MKEQLKGKNYSFDRYIFEFIENNRVKIFITVVSILALLIRVAFFEIKSGDYEVYISQWGQHFMNNGGIWGLKTINSDYNVPYLYLLALLTYLPGSYLVKVKMLSIIFDFIIAILSYKIITKVLVDNKNVKYISAITYAIVLFIPTVILNSGAWAQCDSIYVSFLLFSLYYLIEKKNTTAFVFFGVAFAFKLQAIFILPVFIILYLTNKEFSILNFLIIPIVSLIMYIPALIVGRPLRLLWEIYFLQIGGYGNLTLNCPNIYTLIYGNDAFRKAGIIFTILLLGITCIILLFKNRKIEGSEIIEVSLLIVLIVTFFLPSMHDRYMFMADIVSVLYFIIKKKNICVPIIVVGASLNSYMNFLFGVLPLPPSFVALFLLYAIVKVASEYLLTYER